MTTGESLPNGGGDVPGPDYDADGTIGDNGNDSIEIRGPLRSDVRFVTGEILTTRYRRRDWHRQRSATDEYLMTVTVPVRISSVRPGSPRAAAIRRSRTLHPRTARPGCRGVTVPIRW